MQFSEKAEEILEAGKPFFYETKGNQAVLMIHGFSGTPFHFWKIAKYFKEKGIASLAVRLPGHGTTLENLSKTTHRDWQEAVRIGFNKLNKDYSTIYLLGNSFGANLAFNLATCYPGKIKKIVTISAPIMLYHQRAKTLLVPVVKKVKKDYRKSKMEKIRNGEFNEKWSYHRIPLKGLQSFMEFINDFTKKELSLVDLPVLIIHSKKDILVHPKSANYIYQNLSSKQKELFWLEGYYHNPLVENPKEELFEKIYRFLVE